MRSRLPPSLTTPSPLSGVTLGAHGATASSCLTPIDHGPTRLLRRGTMPIRALPRALLDSSRSSSSMCVCRLRRASWPHEPVTTTGYTALTSRYRIRDRTRHHIRPRTGIRSTSSSHLPTTYHTPRTALLLRSMRILISSSTYHPNTNNARAPLHKNAHMYSPRSQARQYMGHIARAQHGTRPKTPDFTDSH